MGKFPSALLGAYFASISFGWADSVPLAIPAPIPQVEVKLQTLPDVTLASMTSDVPLQATRDTSMHWQQIDKQSDLSAFGFSCDEQLNVEPLPDAHILVTVMAPCRPGQMVQISFGDIDFDITLSMVGELQVAIPSMSNHGEIDTIFDDYSVLSQTVVMPETEGYARVALAWHGMASFQLAARAPKHVETDVITLGDGSGRTAQIMSHRLDPNVSHGVIRLSMSEPVTDANCALQRSGHVVQHIPGEPIVRYNLDLAAAGCGQVGAIRELKNVLPDLKLASN